MMNRAVLVGRLTRDPDLRYTPNGVAVANFTLAVNRPFTNQQGERDADFINCVTWRRQAENLAQYMKKGGQVGVDGRIQTRTYEDKDGKPVYITEVVADNVQFLESRTGSKERGQNQQQQPQYQQNQQPQNQQQQNQQQNQQHPEYSGGGEPIDISDDDLPF